MAQTAGGEAPRIQSVMQPGPDGKLGTADDIDRRSARARRATPSSSSKAAARAATSSRWRLAGTLHGSAGRPGAGPRPRRRRGAGPQPDVHADLHASGDRRRPASATRSTSRSPTRRSRRRTSSASICSAQTSAARRSSASRRARSRSIAPGDSAIGQLRSDRASVTGKVTAATLDSDENVAGPLRAEDRGRRARRAAVARLAGAAEGSERAAARSAQRGARPARQGLGGGDGAGGGAAEGRHALLEEDRLRPRGRSRRGRASASRCTNRCADSAAQLLMDFIGSDYSRLAGAHHEARRSGVRAERLRRLRRAAPPLVARRRVRAGGGGADDRPTWPAPAPPRFTMIVAREDRRTGPAHISVLISQRAARCRSRCVSSTAQGDALGGTTARGQGRQGDSVRRLLQFADAGGAASGADGVHRGAGAGEFTMQLDRVAGVPTGAVHAERGRPRCAGGAAAVRVPERQHGADARADVRRRPIRIACRSTRRDGAAVPLPPASRRSSTRRRRSSASSSRDEPIRYASTSASREACGVPAAIVAVLFSEEVTLPACRTSSRPRTSPTIYPTATSRRRRAAAGPPHRVPRAARSGRAVRAAHDHRSGVVDLRGQAMAAETRADRDHGRRRRRRRVRPRAAADGSPVPFATCGCSTLSRADDDSSWVGISSKSADANGKYLVGLRAAQSPRILARRPGDRRVPRRALHHRAQRPAAERRHRVPRPRHAPRHGRSAKTASRSRTPRSASRSLTDHSQYGATTDAHGRFTVARVPVGNIFIEAVNATAQAQTAISETIPFAGATTTRDLVLLTADSPKAIASRKARSAATCCAAPATGSLGRACRWSCTTSPAASPASAVRRRRECAGRRSRTTRRWTARSRLPACRRANCACRRSTRPTLQEGEAAQQLAADGTRRPSPSCIVGGLGTVKGVVLDAAGHGVPDARVGGGLSLTTTDAAGHFTLTDVPVGRREIVAVSDALGTSATSRRRPHAAGEEVRATIVLDSVGEVAGTVFRLDGAPPVPGHFSVSLQSCRSSTARSKSSVRRSPTSNGHYQMAAIPSADTGCRRSRGDFSDGNVGRRQPQVQQPDGSRPTCEIPRRRPGAVTGTVIGREATRRSSARSSLSGDQLVVAGGRVGVVVRVRPELQDRRHRLLDRDILDGWLVARFVHDPGGRPVQPGSDQPRGDDAGADHDGGPVAQAPADQQGRGQGRETRRYRRSAPACS